MPKQQWITTEIEEFATGLCKLRNKKEMAEFLSDLMTVPEINSLPARLT